MFCLLSGSWRWSADRTKVSCQRASEHEGQDKSLHAGTPSTLIGRCTCEGLGHQDSKLPFQENNCEFVVPNAPPAYEKVSAEQSPPPYSP
ncbi:Melanoma antigen recognized by T-cells 1 [Pteropus alecto]|uniref:Melanoma antigen recognized by T-cells 1 n=1 Tax=Pteropus alecto TaxID=9402 RepID=L5K942_PTEAL|nr:Melanoma antigen recognized by T-cells 1 [Pteropus alecto]